MSVEHAVLHNPRVYRNLYIIRIYRDTLSAGVIALSISYAMQMIDGFGWTIRSLSFSNAIIIVG